MNNPLETSLFDRAARFAVEAHSGTERRGKGFPYIIHPMEAAAIVATITNDQELLAAAILHDVVEDTDVTVEQIRSEFGDRVATLVQHETAPKDKSLDWRGKKQVQLDQLAAADHDSKIVAIGDKLSNIRAIAGDYRLVGDKLWSRFHAPGGKKDIEWYYRGLAGALFELAETLPFQEFVRLLDQTFGLMDYDEAHPVSLDDYVESGGGYYATSYNHRDGQTMVKFYNTGVDKAVPQNELQMASAVQRMNVPTPMPGRLVTDGIRFGAEFRRIDPKESFARYVSNRPDSCEEIAHRFARMCLTLHSTPCNTAVFQSEKEHAATVVQSSTRFSDAEKEKILAFIAQVPDATTCLHGDMHIGNVITNAVGPAANEGTTDFWIDLGDFRWGNPLFDLGMFHLACNLNDEALTQHLYHLDNATMRRIWNIFIRDYFHIGSDGQQSAIVSDEQQSAIGSDEQQSAIERQLDPFAALKLIAFDLQTPLPEQVVGFIRRVFGL